MRIVDQTKLNDIPYDRASIFVEVGVEGGAWIHADVNGADIPMGTYHDEEEAREVMDDMATAYINGEKYFIFREKRKDHSNEYIEELELSVRSYNLLMRAGYKTVADLADKTPRDILRIRGMGKKSLNEICEKLREVGAWK